MTSKKRDLDEAVAGFSVTRSEYALFTALHYGFTYPPAYLPARAVREHYDPDGLRVTEAQCRLALTKCLAKGWLQVIDEPALAEISGELRKGRCLGPIYGLPTVGGVDFTPAGAVLWNRLHDWQLDAAPLAYTDAVHWKIAYYFKTESAALRQIEKAKEYGNEICVVGPTLMGPWRAQWWRRFPEGYRVDIEERLHWQGRSGGGGHGFFLPPPLPDKADPKRLQYVLDCHNVTLAEWLLLAELELKSYHHVSDLPRTAAENANERFGVTAPDDECRIGLESCLRNGWLKRVWNTEDAVEALLRAEPAMMPVKPEVLDREEVDFTPCGAALYRMIAAEWLGPDWEDNFGAYKEYYWEEHRYCEAMGPLRAIVEEYTAQGKTIRASRLAPIGPWCVRWWEQFPAGYRLELEFDD